MIWLLLACDGGTVKDPGSTPPGDDTGTPTEEDDHPVDENLDAAHVLVVSSMNRVTVLDAGGAEVHDWEVDQFVDASACEGGRCRAEGVTADGNGLVVNWALQEREVVGGLLRLDPSDGDMAGTWVMEGWAYPHEVRRDPSSANYIVADAFFDSVSWTPDDGSGDPDDPPFVIDGVDSDAAGHVPNGLCLVEEDGMTGLIVSYRGDDSSNPGGEEGRLAMWDVTNPAQPEMLWKFPDEGHFAAPHDPSLHWRDGRWLLLWAESHGDASRGGTVGVAELPDLRTAPTYLADLKPSGGASWGYPRGALLTGDDTLYVTDTPALGGGASAGAVYVTRLPEGLASTGKSGAYSEAGTNQEFVTVDDVETFADGFEQTYRTILWEPTY